MPMKPPTACGYPGCPNVTRSRYCPAHERARKREYDKKRPSASARGYNHEWKKARDRFLKENPDCASCGVAPATVVDHIVPHRGDPVLFWQASNWQPLCASCHSRKTARHDSGFARRKE